MEYKQKRDWTQGVFVILCILAIILFGVSIVIDLIKARYAAPASTDPLPDGVLLVFELGAVDYGVYYFEHYGNDCYILHGSNGDHLSCIPGPNR